MELLIKEVTLAPSGATQVRDRGLSADTVVVGATVDCHIQLLGSAAIHGRLSLTRKGLVFNCEPGSSVDIDGEAVSRVAIDVGLEVRIAGHRLIAIEPPPGFDAALELHLNPDVEPRFFERAFTTNLSQTWLRQRRPAWITVAAVFLFGLIVPWWVPAGYLPNALNDVVWSSGPLLPGHAVVLGDDCSACHTTPFTRVQDAACTSCHREIADHTLPQFHTAVGLDTVRCASCHQEHHEPSYLTITDSELCTDCHAQSDWPQRSTEQVGAFSGTQHPQFQLDLVTPISIDPGSRQAYDWARQSTAFDTAVEQSNLKFPHDVHLDGGKVQDLATGQSLSCATCHALQADDEHFTPINMERHCIDCHNLKFDRAAPFRNLPHGNPEEAILTMEGHFLRAYTQDRETGGTPRRRLPDRENDAGRCTDTPRVCALQRAALEAENQFTKSGCITCHQVVDNGAVDLVARYHVVPIQLTDDFFLNARFDHQAHLTQTDISGDEACVSCHQATTSTTSADILIPGIEQCLTCHDAHSTEQQVELECASCHAFHPSPELRNLLTLQQKTR